MNTTFLNKKNLLRATVFLSLATFFSACKQDDKRLSENTVTVAISDEPDRLTPFISSSGYATQVIRHIFMPLLAVNPQTLVTEPYLAKAIPTQTLIDTGAFKGGIGYTFELQDAAKWDDGSPITAADVEFSLKIIFNPKVGAKAWRGYFEPVKDFQIDVTNNKKFTVITDHFYMKMEEALRDLLVLQAAHYDPQGLLKTIALRDLADPIVAQKLAEENANIQTFATQYADAKFGREKGAVQGSGAYSLENWETGQRLTLKKKTNWWGNALATQNPNFTAQPDGIIYRPFKDNAAAISELKNGKLDVMNTIRPDIFTALQKNDSVTKSYNFFTPPTTTYAFIGMNSKIPKLADKRVRQALAHLIDNDLVAKNVFKGLATPISSPILPSSPFFNKNLQLITLDIEKSKSLLANAGWTDSNQNGTVDKKINGQLVEMQLQIWILTKGAGKDVALMMQENGKKVGVGIELVAKTDLNTLKNDLKKRDFELYQMGSSADPGLFDPYQDWHSSNDTPDGSNRVGFGNAASDKIIEELRSTRDTDRRRNLYQQFQQTLYDEQPCIFLVNLKERIAIHKRFDRAETTILTPGFDEQFFVLKK